MSPNNSNRMRMPIKEAIGWKIMYLTIFWTSYFTKEGRRVRRLYR